MGHVEEGQLEAVALGSETGDKAEKGHKTFLKRV